MSLAQRSQRTQREGGIPWSAASLARPTGRRPGRARLPNDRTILPEVKCSEGLLRLATSRRSPSRGSMACSRFIWCRILDPRLGEFEGLMELRAFRSFPGAAFVYWPLGSLALPGLICRGSMACSRFMPCRILDPRLGEFEGLMELRAFRSFPGAAFVYWPFGSLALPGPRPVGLASEAALHRTSAIVLPGLIRVLVRSAPLPNHLPVYALSTAARLE
jgi:hypothetical protein